MMLSWRAELKDSLLKVSLEKIVPDHKKQELSILNSLVATTPIYASA